jgi:muramoyltetrapeptide carboxypeptidase
MQPGDLVSVIAPSSAVHPDLFRDAVTSIETLGLRPLYREDILSKEIDFAGTTERRATELEQALRDPATRAIWAVRGGYGASHLLPTLDTEVVRQADKWLIGFSDVTVLHSAWARAGVGSIHGAVGTYLARWSAEARDELREYLFDTGAHVLAGTRIQGDEGVTGRLVGGNLALLASLVGTPYMPDVEDTVLLLEDVDEPPYRLERYLLQLAQAGVLGKARAIVVGQLTDCLASDPADMQASERTLRFLQQHTLAPILADLPIGHDNDSRAVALGALVTVDPVRQTLTVHER